MTDLKPCPFCGGCAAVKIEDGHIATFARCCECGALLEFDKPERIGMPYMEAP